MRVAGQDIRTSASGPVPSGMVTVFVRPEDVIVSLAGQTPGCGSREWNSVPATVEKVTFRGPLTAIHLALQSGGTFTALRKSEKERADPWAIKAGDSVFASWRASSSSLLEDEVEQDELHSR